MYDKSDEFFDELVKYHISGQLKVAPEHISAAVLDKMGKPRKELYLKFVDKFKQKNEEFGMKQFIVPYLMSSHPGSDLNAAIELACYLKKFIIRQNRYRIFTLHQVHRQLVCITQG